MSDFPAWSSSVSCADAARPKLKRRNMMYVVKYKWLDNGGDYKPEWVDDLAEYKSLEDIANDVAYNEVTLSQSWELIAVYEVVSVVFDEEIKNIVAPIKEEIVRKKELARKAKDLQYAIPNQEAIINKLVFWLDNNREDLSELGISKKEQEIQKEKIKLDKIKKTLEEL